MDFLSYAGSYLHDLLYYLYVIHMNAFWSLVHFLSLNLIFVVTLLSMGYIFLHRIEINSDSTYRPVRRVSHYMPENAPRRIEPISLEMSKGATKVVAKYLFLIALFILTFLTTTKAVLYLGTCMWLIGAIAVWRLEGERKEFAQTTEDQIMTYCGSLLMIKAVIFLLVGVPASEWSRALGVALPPAAAGTIVGYLPIMFMTAVIGVPMNFLRLVWQRYSVTKDNRSIPDRQAEIMRTANQSEVDPARFQREMR